MSFITGVKGQQSKAELQAHIIRFDPYQVSKNIFTDLKIAPTLPNLTFADIYIYLIQNPSLYSLTMQCSLYIFAIHRDCGLNVW